MHCKSGKGGAGSVHFRREKFIAKGGPDGGDGGRGGHVIVRANPQLWTLLHLKFRKHVMAEDGQPGMGSLCTGKTGKDVILEVPLGTIARDFETGRVLGEITQAGEEFVVKQGGKGGLGNNHFKSPTNQVPLYAQPGIPCEEGWVVLELKVLADVGLVGFPNAGKSTLLSVLSAAKPEIADYPFTTLTPNLGMVRYKGDRSFVVADIPGIIEGAHAGKGLGIRFLKHIERNALLLFMVPVDAEDIYGQYKILMSELELYNPELLLKDKLLCITKCDLADEEWRNWVLADLKKRLRGKYKTDIVFVSAAMQWGIDGLKDKIMQQLDGK